MLPTFFISVEAACLRRLDQKSGDGDTGSTLATAARAIMTSMDNLPQARYYATIIIRYKSGT